MNFFMLIWILISVLLISFLLWTLVIILQQKKVWKSFSKKYALRFKDTSFTEPPEMEGVIGGYKFNFFSSEHNAKDNRTKRYLTAVEVLLHNQVPFEFTVASGLMVSIFKEIGPSGEYKPKYEAWNDNNICLSDNNNAIELYLTPKRLEVITKLIGVSNASLLLISKGDTFLLRMDIANPLMVSGKLEKLKDMLLKSAKILDMDKAEEGGLKDAQKHLEKKKTALEIKEEELEQAVAALSLEEDEEEGGTDEGAPEEAEKPAEEAPRKSDQNP